jgi:hypothetical protein
MKIYASGGGLATVHPGEARGWGPASCAPWPAALMRTTGKNEKFETFKDTGQLVGSDREAKPSVQCGQYRVGHLVK